MSTLDIVLAQKQILVAIIVTFVPFAVAMTLVVLSQVKRAHAARAVRRQQEALLHQAAIIRNREAAERPSATDARPAAAQDTRETTPHVVVVNGKAQVHPYTEAQAPASPASAASPARTTATMTPVTTETPASSTPPETQEAVASSMQNLLSDVFGDDDAAAHYEVLLRGFEEVSAHDLIALGQQLMARLQQRAALPPASE